MKKLLFVFAIAGIGSLASCQKEYTCVCTDANGDENRIEFPTKMKKSDAEDACDVYEVGGDSCELD